MENTTVSRPAPAAVSASFACSFAGSVVAGRARSIAEMSSDACFADFLPTLTSEHTANVRSDASASIDHSRSDCDSSEIDGTRNSTRPPNGTRVSAIRSDVNVLPVPQAITSLPRSVVANPSRTFSNARLWWGRRRLRSFSSMTSGVNRSNCDQSMLDSARSMNRIRCTGICWFSIA